MTRRWDQNEMHCTAFEVRLGHIPNTWTCTGQHTIRKSAFCIKTESYCYCSGKIKM